MKPSVPIRRSNRRFAPGIIVVLVTCPGAAVGRRLSTELVKRRLAACVNLIPRIASCYRWQGHIERAHEALLVIKTTANRFDPLKRAIRALHPYDCPEIIALSVVAGHAPYLQWVQESVS